MQLTHAVLRGCLNHAVRLGIIIRNPSISTIPPKPIQKEMDVLDESQIQSLLLAAQELQPQYHALYQLVLTTGMRWGNC